MKQKLLGYYRIARPFNALSGGLAVMLGGYVAGTSAWGNVILAALTTFVVTGASNAWNDYLDIEIDKINQPQRPLPAGMISPRGAVVFSLVCTAIALILASFINLPSFMIALISSVVLYIYSWRLKSTVLMGNLTVAGVSAASAIFGGVAAGNVVPSLWLALVIATAIMGREVLKTIADYEGDLRQRVRTVSTVWGRRPARVLFYILAAATIMVMLLPYLLNIYGEPYVYVVAIGVCPIFYYIIVQVKDSSTGRQLERLSQIMKYDFMVWFLAVLVGAAA